MIDAILSNPVFLGMSGAGLLGGAMYVLRAIPALLWRAVEDGIFYEVQVKSNDPAFSWLVLWLSKHTYASRARRLRMTSADSSRDYGDPSPAYVGAAAQKPLLYLLSPGSGWHFFFHNRVPVWLARDSASPSGNSPNVTSSFLLDTITIRILSRQRERLTDLLDEARDMAMAEREQGLVLYAHYTDSWYRAAVRSYRSVDSVVLPAGVMESVIRDVEQFMLSEQWYAARGVPYHRGYLLYGPPGGGKTSLITAVASYFRRSVAIMALSSVEDDRSLQSLFRMVPKDAFLLIEDIDVAFRDRRETSEKGITFAGLLNAIDGIGSAEGLIMFMTTNHRDVLDPALMRPGRADISLELGAASYDQAWRMYMRFFPDEDAADAFAVENAGRMPADIQGMLLSNRGSKDFVGVGIGD